jgi:hypothetical protein
MSSDRDPAARPDFPASFGAAAGGKLRVVPSETRPRRTPLSWWVRRLSDGYDVLSVGGAAASISGIAVGRPVMATSAGVWSLEKRGRVGWEYTLVDSNGQEVGAYSGRSWLLGGTISLIDGTKAHLRRSFGRAWKVLIADAHERCVDIRKSRSPGGATLALTIRSVPTMTLDMHLLVLTACTVLLLGDTVPAVPVYAGGG